MLLSGVLTDVSGASGDGVGESPPPQAVSNELSAMATRLSRVLVRKDILHLQRRWTMQC